MVIVEAVESCPEYSPPSNASPAKCANTFLFAPAGEDAINMVAGTLPLPSVLADADIGTLPSMAVPLYLVSLSTKKRGVDKSLTPSTPPLSLSTRYGPEAVNSKYHLALAGNVGPSVEVPTLSLNSVACLSMVIVETGSFRLYRLFPKKLIFTSFPVPVFCEAIRWVDGSLPSGSVPPAAAVTGELSTALPVNVNSEDESPEIGVPASVSVITIGLAGLFGTLKPKNHFLLAGRSGAVRATSCFSMVMVELASFILYRLFPKKLIFTSFPVSVFSEASSSVDGSLPSGSVPPAA